MKRTRTALGLIAAICLPAAALGQDSKPGAPAKPAAQPDKAEAPGAPTAEQMAMYEELAKPGAEHELLKQFEGKWKTKMRVEMPGMEEESEGSMQNTWVLGGRFLRQEFKGSMMGAPFEGLGYWGYDKAKKQWVSSWMDSWGTGMMTSQNGTYDPATKTWTINSKYFNPESGKDEVHREVIKVIDTDTHTMDMYMVGDEGEMKMMTITYTRIGGGKGEAKGHDKHDKPEQGGGKENKPPRKN